MTAKLQQVTDEKLRAFGERFLDAMADLQAEERGPALWRSDMERAPRDGSDVLLAGEIMHDEPGGPFWEYIVAAWDVEEAGGENGWAIESGLTPIHFTPSHWMPIFPPSKD